MKYRRLFATGSYGVRQKMVAWTLLHLGLTQDHHRIAGLERVGAGGFAIQPNQCAQGGHHMPQSAADAADFDLVE
jgi:hypothetical protein